MNSNMPQHQINLDRFSQMQKQLGEVFAQLISAYITQSDQLIDAMPAQLEQQQYAELQRHAHSIKSSSLNIGAEPLSDMAQQLENLSEKALNETHIEQTQLQQLIMQIQQEYSELKPLLEEYR
jgi:HPt (histidine-containing phosphotransfer) domain-containing protein